MLPVYEPWISKRERELVADTMETGWISPRGEYVSEFEEHFSNFIGCKHALAVSTGTAALHLSLIVAELGPGDEVLIPDLTWISCANVVRYVGAEPVFVDVNPESFTLDPERLQDHVTPSTEAVMPVHLYGQPCDMSPILDFADTHDLTVIEDAAEAHGAVYDGKRVGSLGDVGCFSFYGNKILTTGQGGMITTDDDQLAEKLRLYRRDGMSKQRKYYHPVVGYNYRLTNVQAAIGVAQLERIQEILKEKRRVADTYRKECNHKGVHFQKAHGSSEPVHWMVSPVFETGAQRQRVEKHLTDAGVETRPFFYPLHEQPPYTPSDTECPITEALSERGLNLPSGPLLEDREIEEVCDHIKSAL